MKLLITALSIGIGLTAVSQVISSKPNLRPTEPANRPSFKSDVIIRPHDPVQSPATDSSPDRLTEPKQSTVITPKQIKTSRSQSRPTNREIMKELDLNRRKSEAEYFVQTAKTDPNFRETIRLTYRINGYSGTAPVSLQGIEQEDGTIGYRFLLFDPAYGKEIEGLLTGNHLNLKAGSETLFDGTADEFVDGIQGTVQDELIGVIRFESEGVYLEWGVS